MKSLVLSLVLLIGTMAQALADESPTSLYNLDAQLTNQAGKHHGFDVYRGHPVLVTMFYGSCPMACPLLIETVRSVERSTPEAQRKDLRVLMISIDPDKDTPQALATLARERRVDTSRWTLAHADAATVRNIAALLNIQYRKLPDGGYNHSSVITLLSAGGDIRAQSSIMGKPDEALVVAISGGTGGARSATASLSP